MEISQSFPPVIQDASHTLILGSMPGKRSLTEVQYYAHPRNAFWHIMGKLFGAGSDNPYEHRLDILLHNGLALWDVIGSCRRETSLDTDIEESSIAANDFRHLLITYPNIKKIIFNGTKAESTFAKYVRPSISELLHDIELFRLTSTSPANARYSLNDKIAQWQKHL